MLINSSVTDRVRFHGTKADRLGSLGICVGAEMQLRDTCAISLTRFCGLGHRRKVISLKMFSCRITSLKDVFLIEDKVRYHLHDRVGKISLIVNSLQHSLNVIFLYLLFADFHFLRDNHDLRFLV